MTTLREAAQQAIADICAARLCEVNSMSSRQEMLRLMIRATDTLRRALEQPEQDEHITDGSLCWCGPELAYVDPENGAKVWVHRAINQPEPDVPETDCGILQKKLADARLIAAVPSLRAALQRLVEHDEYMIEMGTLHSFIEVEEARALLDSLPDEADA